MPSAESSPESHHPSTAAIRDQVALGPAPAQGASSLPLKVEYALGEQVATRSAFGTALEASARLREQGMCTRVIDEFLIEGLRQGERCLLISLAESPEEVALIAHAHGWSIEGLEVRDLVSSDEIHSTALFDLSEIALDDRRRSSACSTISPISRASLAASSASSASRWI